MSVRGSVAQRKERRHPYSPAYPPSLSKSKRRCKMSRTKRHSTVRRDTWRNHSACTANLCAPAFRAAVWGATATCMRSLFKLTMIRIRGWPTVDCRTCIAHAKLTMKVAWVRERSATQTRCAWSRSAHLGIAITRIWAKFTPVTSQPSKNSSLSRTKNRGRVAANSCSPRSRKRRILLGRRIIARPKLSQRPASREIYRSCSAERQTKK